MNRLFSVLGLAAALSNSIATAQERAPAAREQLADLARILGEGHALRQACLGPRDQYWRTRMQRLLDVEAADERLKTRLSVSFNAGYHAWQAQYPACTPAARQEGQRLALRGQALAQSLAAP